MSETMAQPAGRGISPIEEEFNRINAAFDSLDIAIKEIDGRLMTIRRPEPNVASLEPESVPHEIGSDIRNRLRNIEETLMDHRRRLVIITESLEI
jgi:hypothetical protein